MTTLTIQSEAAAEYVICQYMPDPFRREPRNVGVIVKHGGQVLHRFAGESTSGIDARRVRWIHDSQAYRQWVRFWTKNCTQQDWKERLLSSGKRHYYVIDGGCLLGSEQHEAEKVVDYLFAVLVDNAGLDQLLHDTVDNELNREFKVEVSALFRQQGLMSNQISSGHGAIFADRDLFGLTQPHRFAFVQFNGHKRPMELFDFDRTPRKTLEYHAGWARNAFLDVCKADQNVQPFALVAPPESIQKREAFDYAQGLLETVCEWVNLRDPRQSQEFINDCKRVAGLML